MKFGKYFRSVIEEAQPDLRDKVSSGALGVKREVRRD